MNTPLQQIEALSLHPSLKVSPEQRPAIVRNILHRSTKGTGVELFLTKKKWLHPIRLIHNLSFNWARACLCVVYKLH